MVESSTSPSKENKSPQSGRVLFCRKCECHGLQVILKGHAPKCPYELCNCHACEKLMNKRMRSFEKRNGELIKSALNAKRNLIPNSVSPVSSGSDHDQEMHANGKPMTVMSYDIWKKKCAQEKLEREAKKAENPVPVTRKRTYPFGDETVTLNHPLPTKGTYVNLPTIPPMRVLLDPERRTIILPEARGISPTLSVHSTPSASTTSHSPTSRPRLSSLPLPSIPSSLPPSLTSRLSSAPSTSIDLPRPHASIPSSTTVVSSHPPTVVSSHRPTVVSSHPPTVVSSHPPTVVSSHRPTVVSSHLPTVVSSNLHTVIPSHPATVASTSSLTPSDISSILNNMPNSMLLRNCALNHERQQKGLPVVDLTQHMTTPSIVPLPLPTLATHSVESSLLNQLATLIGTQSQSTLPIPTSMSAIPSFSPYQIPSTQSTFLPPPLPLTTPKIDPTLLSPEILQLLSHNFVQYFSQ